MTFARQCIKHCMQQHEECRRPLGQVGTGVRLDASDIPTRLLKIVLAKSGDEDEVCAVQLVMKKPAHDQESTMTTDDVAEHGYAALSYCWGTAQPLVLNASTAERLHTQVPLTALPLTIQDAVRMASAVGLSYIWIDALCIMQDSDDDKAGEIARMAQYYGCSALTISAASAARCSDGFLGQRTDSAEDYTLGPVVLQAQTATGTMGRVLLLGEKLERNGFEQPPEPTTRRGWTLQESLLSRRLLIFSSRQLHFTCMVGNASCGGSQPAQLTKRGFAAYLSPVPGIATLSGLYELPISRMWFVTVTQYTRRRVTDAGDKLPALSAVASVLVAMARDQRGETLTYLAGLFLDTTTPESPDTLAFLADLLWHTNRMDEAAVLPDNRPSWSWASVDGSVVPHGRIRDVEVAEAAKLCAHHIELDNQLNPYGKVRSGRLVLEARTCRLPLGAAEPHVFVTPDAPASEKQPGTLSIYPDTPLRRKAVLSSPLACDVRLVGLIFQKDAIHGLVVTSAEGEEMQRIGTFEYYPDEEKSPFQGPRRIVLV